jgi:ribosomal protein L40E
MDEKHQQAIDAIKAGRKAEGGRALAEIVKANPDDELAWQWLAAVVVPEEQKRHCLGQVLRINPQNIDARKMLDALDFQPVFDISENIEKPAADKRKIISRANSRICPNCKAPMPISANICPHCGRRFGVLLEKKNQGPRTLYIVTFLLCTPVWAVLMLNDKEQGTGTKTVAVLYLVFVFIVFINLFSPGLLR